MFVKHFCLKPCMTLPTLYIIGASQENYVLPVFSFKIYKELHSYTFITIYIDIRCNVKLKNPK